MAEQKPISFEDLMTATEPAAPVSAAAANLTPVRYFTADGLDEVAKLLKTIRTDKTLHRDEVEELLDDPQYAKQLDPNGASVQHAIDRSRTFTTKLDLCEYFTGIFDNAFLETNRKNAGLWTWLALAYYSQFVKTKGGAVKLSTDDCWLYRPDSNRYARRHFIAAPIYLYCDIHEKREDVLGMIFSRPVTEFNKLLDYLTNVSDSIRTPSYLIVAAGLYYDPHSSGKYKKGCLSLSTAGNVFQFTRVLQQLRETYDFTTDADAVNLWNMLPAQFEEFKNTLATGLK